MTSVADPDVNIVSRETRYRYCGTKHSASINYDVSFLDVITTPRFQVFMISYSDINSISQPRLDSGQLTLANLDLARIVGP